ncbi:MAG: hypothetical protein IID59_04340 [Proteobacteria bacterium]|nr:hypothetical protein [Pseudomonadota bacterium]
MLAVERQDDYLGLLNMAQRRAITMTLAHRNVVRPPTSGSGQNLPASLPEKLIPKRQLSAY